MKILRIPGLIFISFLFFSAGCSIRNYRLSDLKDSSTASPLQPVFDDTFTTALFKAQVDLYGKHFGGLLFLKSMNDSSYRLIMTTETGMQLFDMEIAPDTMIVHQCFEQLNRDAVIKTIETDFRLILMEDALKETPVMLKDENSHHTVYRMKEGKKLTYYFIENKTGYLDRIERASPWFKKISVSLDQHEHGMANRIIFKHHNIRLEIRLRLLKKS